MINLSIKWTLVHFVMLTFWCPSSSSLSIVDQQPLSKHENEVNFVPCSGEKEEDDIRKVLESVKCTECDDGKEEAKKDLTQQEIKLLQAYLVKKKILEELNLKSEPCPKMPKPPQQVVQAIINAHDDNYTHGHNSDEITTTVRTESVAVLPTSEERSECDVREPCSIRLDYSLPKEIGTRKLLLSLELWVPDRLKTPSEESIRAVATYSVRGQENSCCVLEPQPLDEGLPQNGSSTRELQDWWQFQLNFQNCSNQLQGLSTITVHLQGLSTDEIKPFVLVRSSVEEKHLPTRSREKRSALCVEGSKTCCRQPLYLNFTELEMDRWILHPPGYSAYSCRGECLSDISSSRDHYTSLLMDYIQVHPSLAKTLGLSVCCVPSMTSPLSLVYRNDDGIIFPHKSLSGMIVEGCVCA